MEPEYLTRIELELETRWWRDPPLISIRFNGQEQTLELSKDRVFEFQHMSTAGCHSLEVELLNKQDSDTQPGLDKAVIVKSISFNGIKSDRFRWAAKYYPCYPDHLKNNPTVLEAHDYISWNGTWRLEFQTPIFTWIHNIENLGWIYD